MKIICSKCKEVNKCSIWDATNARTVICKNCRYYNNMNGVVIFFVRYFFHLVIIAASMAFNSFYLRNVVSDSLVGFVLVILFSIIIFIVLMPLIALINCSIVNCKAKKGASIKN